METFCPRASRWNPTNLGNFLVEWKHASYQHAPAGNRPWKLPSGMETHDVAGQERGLQHLGNFLVEWKQSPGVQLFQNRTALETS